MCCRCRGSSLRRAQALRFLTNTLSDFFGTLAFKSCTLCGLRKEAAPSRKGSEASDAWAKFFRSPSPAPTSPHPHSPGPCTLLSCSLTPIPCQKHRGHKFSPIFPGKLARRITASTDTDRQENSFLVPSLQSQRSSEVMYLLRHSRAVTKLGCWAMRRRNLDTCSPPPKKSRIFI